MKRLPTGSNVSLRLKLKKDHRLDGPFFGRSVRPWPNTATRSITRAVGSERSAKPSDRAVARRAHSTPIPIRFSADNPRNSGDR